VHKVIPRPTTLRAVGKNNYRVRKRESKSMATLDVEGVATILPSENRHYCDLEALR
jgi:hypothetical protein